MIFLVIEHERYGGWQEEPERYDFNMLRCEMEYSQDVKGKYLDYLRGDNEFYYSIFYSAEDYFSKLKDKDETILYSATRSGFEYKENPFEILKREYNVIYDSDKRIITEDEITNFTSDELDKAYNEIFARHGHDFKTRSLKEFFNGFLWYTPKIGKTVPLEELSEIERLNLQTIKRVKERKS